MVKHHLVLEHRTPRFPHANLLEKNFFKKVSNSNNTKTVKTSGEELLAKFTKANSVCLDKRYHLNSPNHFTSYEVTVYKRWNYFNLFRVSYLAWSLLQETTYT